MDVISAYRDVGSYRGAAAICGTTHKTVKRVIDLHEAGNVRVEKTPRPRNYDEVADLVAKRVKDTSGRISAKRLLPEAHAGGYAGSARNLRRLVAEAKIEWRRDNPRGRRPAVWSPGETLMIDWGVLDGVHVFCAVLAWSRFRFVRFAGDERATTTLGFLAECFRGARRCPQGRPRGQDGVPEGWRGSQTWSSRLRTMSASPPTTGSGRTSARPPTRSPRGWWRTWSAMPRTT